VPQGGSTRFNQPDAASTSINRVLGNDPSRILGTLSSNGRLVLVNPSGITVGQGAAVTPPASPRRRCACRTRCDRRPTALRRPRAGRGAAGGRHVLARAR
jgi:filamentous hemagglutinin family protein